MTARLLCFGQLADLTGPGPHQLDLPDQASVQHVIDAAFSRWPALAPWDSSLLVAVNLQFASRTDPIPPDAEVALMPPVQGG
jgi:molybdopterin converting factor small subunit